MYLLSSDSGYPEDDRLEYQLRTTQVLHDQIQATLNAECQAAEILARADVMLGRCKAQVQEALGYSHWGAKVAVLYSRLALIFISFLA